ncbi:MAG: hypothetical protein QM820_61685 [Minicystis sp.]
MLHDDPGQGAERGVDVERLDERGGRLRQDLPRPLHPRAFGDVDLDGHRARGLAPGAADRDRGAQDRAAHTVEGLDLELLFGRRLTGRDHPREPRPEGHLRLPAIIHPPRPEVPEVLCALRYGHRAAPDPSRRGVRLDHASSGIQHDDPDGEGRQHRGQAAALEVELLQDGARGVLATAPVQRAAKPVDEQPFAEPPLPEIHRVPRRLEQLAEAKKPRCHLFLLHVRGDQQDRQGGPRRLLVQRVAERRDVHRRERRVHEHGRARAFADRRAELSHVGDDLRREAAFGRRGRDGLRVILRGRENQDALFALHGQPIQLMGRRPRTVLTRLGIRARSWPEGFRARQAKCQGAVAPRSVSMVTRTSEHGIGGPGTSMISGG